MLLCLFFESLLVEIKNLSYIKIAFLLDFSYKGQLFIQKKSDLNI